MSYVGVFVGYNMKFKLRYLKAKATQMWKLSFLLRILLLRIHSRVDLHIANLCRAWQLACVGSSLCLIDHV